LEIERLRGPDVHLVSAERQREGLTVGRDDGLPRSGGASAPCHGHARDVAFDRLNDRPRGAELLHDLRGIVTGIARGTTRDTGEESGGRGEDEARKHDDFLWPTEKVQRGT